MKKITYVTNNKAKIASAKKALKPLGYEIDNIKIETPEIQADDVTEVAKYSAKWAAEELKVPVLKNDSGLFIKALNGFPGVYTHFVDDTIGEGGILKLMAVERVIIKRKYINQVTFVMLKIKIVLSHYMLIGKLIL